jgi:hypothetical protein
MIRVILGTCLAAAATFAAPATAANLIVAGDATIAARMATAAATGNAALAGNLTFARNILGGGDRVSIYRFSVVNTFPNPPLGEQLATVYNGFTGVTATTFTTGITSGVLQDADLLVVLGRSNAFTTDEIGLVRNFLVGGGRVLLAGESANIGATANTNLNGLLAGIGSSIRLNQVTEGIGDQFATGSEILDNPLTAGITSFGYGRTTTVSGGTTLFLNDSGNPFIAVDAVVPEPGTWALMIAGFGLAGAAVRRRRPAIAFA